MGIIQEIQNELLSPQSVLSETMRKAYIPAVKLRLKELKDWLDKETQGYSENIAQVPSYRCLHGQCRGFNFFQMWENINFDSYETGNELSKIEYKASIFEIEKLLQNPNVMEFHIALPSNLIMKYNITNCTQLAIFIEGRKLQNIINSAKSVLISYIAELDDIGIEGNNSNFTQAEKDKAQTIVNQTINISGGNFMNQIASENSMQELNDGLDIQQIQTIIQLLQSLQNSIEINENTKKELKNELLTITKELQQPLPKSSIIKEGLKSIRTILEGAAGGALTQTVLSIFHLLGF